MLLFLGKHSTLGENPSWDDLDWEKVLAIGRHQNLIPLFYHVLFSHQELLEKVPSQVQEELEEGFLDDTALTLLYDDLLQKMLISLHHRFSQSAKRHINITSGTAGFIQNGVPIQRG